MNFSLLLPLLFLLLFGYALAKKVRLYDCFTEGVKGAAPLVLSVFPYLCGILILSELFTQSGLAALFTRAAAPLLRAFSIPEELAPLVLMKPFSGSGSTALLSELLAAYGADSEIGRCACVLYGSSETVFYISAVYYANVRGRIPAAPVVISLVANFLAASVGCLLCKVI